MPANLRVIEVRLDVSDLEASMAFYVEVLGFAVTTRWPADAPTFAILEQGGRRLQLAQRTRGSSKGASCSLWLDVEGLDAWHARVAAKRAIAWGPERYAYGRSEFAFHDPDGVLVILSEPDGCATA